MSTPQQCKECNEEFTLADGDIEFFKSKGLELPKRCKKCRDKRRRDREQESRH